MDNDIKFLTRIASLASLGKKLKLKTELTKALSAGVKIEKIEETILQCYLFAGFPAVIEGFTVLRTLVNKNSTKAKPYNVKKFYLDGIKTCKKVYRGNFGKLTQNINSLHPELYEWMIIEGYGKVLSRDTLSLKERELINVAILTSLDWERQLLSHLKGTLNTGARREEIIKVIKNISNICGTRKISKALKIFRKIS